MLSLRCLFCDHVNPPDAKFCNHCGSSLQVKLCGRCKAVNDEAATTCLKCRTNFPVLSTGSVSPPMSSAQENASPSAEFNEPLPFRLSAIFDDVKSASSTAKATADAYSSVVSEAAFATTGSTAPQQPAPGATLELGRVERAFDPQRPTFEEPTPSLPAGYDSAHAPEPEPAGGSQAISGRWPGDDTAMTREAGPEIVMREPPTLGGSVTSLFSAAQQATPQVPPRSLEATAEPRKMSRVTLAVALPAVALAIGVLGYYLYSQSLQLNERQGAQAVSPGPSDFNAGGPPPQPISNVGVTASPMPSTSPGMGSGAGGGTEKPPPPVEPSTAVTSSTVSQDATAASDSTGAAGQKGSPNDPPRQVSTSDQVSLRQESAAKTEGAITKPGLPAADAGDVRDKTIGAPGNEISAKRSTTKPPVRRYPAAGATGPAQSPPSGDRSTARTGAPPSRTCTEAVAALGLCSLNSAVESKNSAGESK
jgi:ribosomal protein L40E